MSNFHIETLVKERKDHECTECRTRIKKGEVYHKHSGCYDDDMFTHESEMQRAVSATGIKHEHFKSIRMA